MRPDHTTPACTPTAPSAPFTDWFTDITLITPQNSKVALEAFLSQNPHLTSLPPPSPTVISPEGLTLTTGTAELLRLPEVQACIKSDFIILPCDLVCDVPGVTFLESWMTTHGALDASWDGEWVESRTSSLIGVGGERCGRRGGISVWYPTGPDGTKSKTEVADFLAITPLDKDEAPTVRAGGQDPSPLTKLVYTMPMASLKDIMEEHQALLIRHSLLKRHGKIKLLTTYRDAHIYIFPYWVKEMAMMNETFESISEDLVGWWAKAEWQNGLGEKLGLREIFDPERDHGSKYSNKRDQVQEDIDLMAMSTTKSTRWLDINPNGTTSQSRPGPLTRSDTLQEIEIPPPPTEKLDVPPVLAYIHSSKPTEPLIRRVDNPSLLLSTSLRLAKLDAISDFSDPALASPLAHQNKIAYPAGIAQRCTVTQADCLIAENVTVEERSVIKESVIGANCHIASGVRLTRCVLMDGVVIGERSQLTDCIVGWRSKVGRECVLKDCEVQNGNVVPDETDAKNEQFMIFEGLGEDMADASDGEGGQGEGIDMGDEFGS